MAQSANRFMLFPLCQLMAGGGLIHGGRSGRLFQPFEYRRIPFVVSVAVRNDELDSKVHVRVYHYNRSNSSQIKMLSNLPILIICLGKWYALPYNERIASIACNGRIVAD